MPDPPVKDLYEILGVSNRATELEIKRRYRFLSHAFHPDKFGSDEHRSGAEEEFKRIKEAYEVLSDPVRRARFDATRSHASTPPPRWEQPPEAGGSRSENSQARTASRGTVGRASPVLRWAILLIIGVLVSKQVWNWGTSRGVWLEADKAIGEMKFGSVAHAGKDFRNALGMDMVWVSPGKFLMGDADGKGDPDEKPVREVRLTRGFYFGASEVTQGQWRELMGSNPSEFVGDDLPVEGVSWDKAAACCVKLTEKEWAAGTLPAGYEYGLPTEAQWEYGCRAGTGADYAGNLDEMGWYSGNSGRKTHPVKGKQRNAWGLYDMHGNVWEWCADWYGPYEGLSTTDPTGAATGTYRVSRGGGWGLDAGYCRSALRNWNRPGNCSASIGFRVALRWVGK